jgi:tRNA dimethylallyltransferase
VAERILAIFGPTASGKTSVAESIAERIPAEIVSADAMQVYRGLPILTAQPERPTRLVAIWGLDHEASVGAYAGLAHAAVDEILGGGRTPVVAGGTGLYLRAALAELDLPPAPSPGARARWEGFYDADPERAHGELRARDPAAAAAVHLNDRRRVVRALELAEAGSSLVPRRHTLWTGEMRHPTLLVGLDVPADELDRRIRARTEQMFDRGVQREVELALAAPLSRTAAQVLGLREVAGLPREEAAEAIVRRTRRYATYQRKWMRRLPGLVTVRADRPAGEVAGDILRRFRGNAAPPPGVQGP